MYTLLLVDDEPEILEGLREVVDFDSLGFQVVGEAMNGVDALQLCQQLKPDLVITDIRMPMMDGLTLCGKLRALFPTMQFIILSGYDDFEYARQAIAVKTLGYLLKPISAKEFVEMLRGARESLDEAANQRRDILKLRQRFHQSLPLLKEALCSALLQGGISKEAALRQAALYELEIQAPAYLVMMLHIGEEEGPDRLSDPELLPFAAHNIFSEVLSEQGSAILFHHRGMIAGILLMEDAGIACFNDKRRAVEKAQQVAAYYLRCALSIGLSTPCRSLEALPAAARQAESALDQSVFSGRGELLSIQDLAQESSTDLAMEEYQLRQLINAIKVGEQELALTLLKGIMARCREGSPAAKDYQIYLMELFMGLLRILLEMSLSRADFDEDFDLISRAVLSSRLSIGEAEEMFERLVLNLLNALQDSRQSAGQLLARQAEDYLKQHYMKENISIESLCLHLHVSPSHFSQVFKRETRKTFHQYLTELRMDRALTLLSQGELRTSQVAREVGLPDPSYFSYSFKKHFGYPPSQARGQRDRP